MSPRRSPEGRDDAEPLTDEDRRVIAERHERRRERLAAAGRLDLIGDSSWYEPHADGIQVREEVHVWPDQRP